MDSFFFLYCCPQLKAVVPSSEPSVPSYEIITDLSLSDASGKTLGPNLGNNPALVLKWREMGPKAILSPNCYTNLGPGDQRVCKGDLHTGIVWGEMQISFMPHGRC